LSAENSSVPVKIPVNPHRVGHEGHGDHQMRNPLKKGGKVSKGSSRILAGLEVGVLKNIT
jgi:hypothetical protein